MTVVLLGLLTLTLIYLSFGAAFALADLIGSLTFGFCIVAAVYLFILILFVIFRHKWIENHCQISGQPLNGKITSFSQHDKSFRNHKI